MDRHYEGMTLQEITDFLFIEDPPEAADLIFVFSGRHQERALRAAELYQAGLAPKILVSGGDKRGTGQSEAQTLKKVLLAQGVPQEAIILEEKAANTNERVLYSYPLIEQHLGWQNIKTVILVAAPMQMRRAKRVFAQHCPPAVKILCVPDNRSDITKNNWWLNDNARRIVLRELEKVRDLAFKGTL